MYLLELSYLIGVPGTGLAATAVFGESAPLAPVPPLLLQLVAAAITKTAKPVLAHHFQNIHNKCVISDSKIGRGVVLGSCLFILTCEDGKKVHGPLSTVHVIFKDYS